LGEESLIVDSIYYFNKIVKLKLKLKIKLKLKLKSKLKSK